MALLDLPGAILAMVFAMLFAMVGAPRNACGAPRSACAEHLHCDDFRLDLASARSLLSTWVSGIIRGTFGGTMLRITFRHLSSSDSLRALAEEQFDKLRQHHDHAADCHLVVEEARGVHAHSPARFTARVELSVERARTRLTGSCVNDDAALAVRAAFDKVERQITRKEEREHDGAHDPGGDFPAQ